MVATARGVFNSNGGVLSSIETGVSIIIPQGAIPEGVEQEIYFKVCRDNSILPPLDKEKGECVISCLVSITRVALCAFPSLLCSVDRIPLDLCSPPTLAALKFLLLGRATLKFLLLGRASRMSTGERGACVCYLHCDGDSRGWVIGHSCTCQPVLGDLTRFLSLSRSFLPCSSRDGLGNTHSKGLALCCHLLVECKALGPDLPHCADLAQVNTPQRRKHPHRLSQCVFLSCFRNLGMLLFFTVFQICQDEMIMNHVATSFRIF